jgi:hypothetical protein
MDQRNDPAIIELKRIVENELDSPVTFVYANFTEANFGIDEIETTEDKPAFVFLSTDQSKNRTTESGLIVRRISVVGMMLMSVDSGTNELSSEEANVYIYKMHKLINNMIFKLNKSQLTHKENPIVEWDLNKVYEKFDKSLVGAATIFNWDFNTNSRGC